MGSKIVLTLVALSVLAHAAHAQTQADRERARIQNKLGWEDMRAEQWERAIKSFQSAIAIDPAFEIPYYGLGRAYMALKNFSFAITSYEKCRDLFRAQAGRQFANVQEAQRYRHDRITEIDEQIRQVQSLRPSPQQSDMIRQLQDQRRDIQESITRGNDTTLTSAVPAYVSLALGSAYFRAGRLTDAEREYKETISTDRRSGEAHSNLAVVYLETERFDLALSSIETAKRMGFRVNPELEKVIRAKSKR